MRVCFRQLQRLTSHEKQEVDRDSDLELQGKPDGNPEEDGVINKYATLRSHRGRSVTEAVDLTDPETKFK